MKKLIDKIFAKLGYFPRDMFGETLVELARESLKRKGAITWVGNVVRIKIEARDL